MTRQAMVEKTVQIMNQLPPNRASEISDFADFLVKKYEDELLLSNIAQMASQGNSFEFLIDEEDIYCANDLKVKYNG